MKTLSFTDFCIQDAAVLDDVVTNDAETIITRAGHEPVVIVSLSGYQTLRETAELLRSPANARHLLDATERLESGHGPRPHRGLMLISPPLTGHRPRAGSPVPGPDRERN